MRSLRKRVIFKHGILLFLITFLSAQANAALDISASDENGTPVTGFKWTLEEDQTFDVEPGVQTTISLSLSFHNSYSPLVSSGLCSGSVCTVDTDPTKRYFVTVLPYSGHTIGGASVAAGATSVDVYTHTTPIPTAQITVRVFHDNHPINGAPDDPEEMVYPGSVDRPFHVKVFDAGGRYGQTGGEVIQDAYGNPMGTEYNPDGSVAVMGSGVLTPDPVTGMITIANLPPAKYGVEVTPPSGENWVQTSTIEGTKTVDAWVAADEPPYFAEFGPPGPHVFIGFVQPMDLLSTLPAPNGYSTITGTVVNNHMSRPPEVGFFPGAPFPACWVGLSLPVAAGGQSVYAAPCNDDSTFTINNVPAGTYTLVVWDDNKDIVIAQTTVNAADEAGNPITVTLGDAPVFGWFTRMESRVFLDSNENGLRDPGEALLPEQPVNLRFRNGTTYQSFPTDLEGFSPFDEIFPFFHWLVAEVDFARYKATGVTYVVDGGGEIPLDLGWDMPSFDILNPQDQGVINPETGNPWSTTLTGPVLTLGIQGFLGQTSVIEWGKALYGPGENGGISGMVLYAITRAEDDARYAAGEEWEPGIPRIQLNLYQDADDDNVIDDLDQSGGITLPDVDNYPLDNFPGAEDIDRNGNLAFDYGDAIQVTWTDSWDDNLPAGCKGPVYTAHPGTPLELVLDCFDGLRNFNQVREGVFDGGYAFDSRIERDGSGVPTGAVIDGLEVGYYIVEVHVPDGYELLKEEDKNVDFGDEYTVPALLPPHCVGDLHLVPDYLTYQTDDLGAPLPGIAGGDLIAAPFAGTERPLCDRKKIVLTGAKNAAADFFLFTQAPISAHVVGGILNDLGNEFDPNNPNFGEKWAPSWVPVTFSDYTGRVVAKVYADEFGKFNALLPSTYTVNTPTATGMSPNMLVSCMNDPSPIPNPAYDPTDPTTTPFINDPFYNPQFSTFCYTFQYMPGSTTYLDTPIVPIAAFAASGEFPVDCELADNQPLIKFVDGPDGGPVITSDITDEALRTLTIVAEGTVAVPNHLFGAPGEPITVLRNYGFGDVQGTGGVTLSGTPLNVAAWSNDVIVVTVPVGVPTGQLMVTTDSGDQSPRGITVTTDLTAANVHRVAVTDGPGAIQAAIDAPTTLPGDLVLVGPGTYSELVIMDKPVQLQGHGAGVSIINAIQVPVTKLENWRNDIATRAALGTFDYLPGQVGFNAEEGPGVIVVGQATNNFLETHQARIDGLTISGAASGGGVFVNGYVDYFGVSNNRIVNNSGAWAGGVRVGNPVLTNEDPIAGLIHTDSENDFISIHHNQVLQNGSTFDHGGGIVLYTGSDEYDVSSNYVCGNFSQGNGAGISHIGLSNDGRIADNIVAFNQSFNQGNNVHGAGITVIGKPGLEGGATDGAGNVVIEGNLAQGNLAGAGHGGGIYLGLVNGIDVQANPGDSSLWYGVDIFDNIIVNNVTGWTGAGIGLADAAKVRIVNNTIAYNDATATVGNVFDPVLNTSTAQPGAGIVSLPHSATLAVASGQAFTDPDLLNNIVWQNRSFSWTADLTTTPATFSLVLDPTLNDVAVLGGAGTLNPLSSILTDTTGFDASNFSIDPEFVSHYVNTDRSQTIIQQEVTINFPGTAAAFDEGGNFVDLHFGPLSLVGDYHLRTTSPAIDAGVDLIVTIPALADDFDGDIRPGGATVDIGADETNVAAVDTDGDTIPDNLDNCTLVPNPDQTDTDNDGYGNICDADLNNDGLLTAIDIGIFINHISTQNLVSDFNGDGVVSAIDIALFITLFNQGIVGPSGLVD
jgi:hypothetical protein